ncbi:hypothetical protein T552_02687 [Pneumocystis carinii B80]|uniref:Elongator complex protein 5 n=1 Tax=Pneumocystis carinii (strain B80) TaxID=1408658 RepID=A0A0W4ZE88_PNEC8|nr:hypothetical protein T552_02687 [Pneumocystis carinii B80]KTW26679.1 hypothetical protein T552_02687 [Pneumocystis carinii B80]
MIEKKTPLIIERLLSFKELSPLITIFDTILQSSWPLIYHFLKRAKSLNIISIHMKTETSIMHHATSDYSIPLFYKDNKNLMRKDLSTLIYNIKEIISKYEISQRFIILVDSIDAFNLTNKINISDIITSILTLNGSITLILINHLSIPLPKSYPVYYPLPSELLSYISTTIISIQSLSHKIAIKNAKDKALTTPLENDSYIEGVIVALDSNDTSGIFIDTEHRRKNGKCIHEESVLMLKTGVIKSIVDIEQFKKKTYIIEKQIEDLNINFNLTLTDKQKKQKENVILPHFKSQTIYQPESLIFYTPDSEDDLDEEDPDNDLLL